MRKRLVRTASRRMNRGTHSDGLSVDLELMLVCEKYWSASVLWCYFLDKRYRLLRGTPQGAPPQHESTVNNFSLFTLIHPEDDNANASSK